MTPQGSDVVRLRLSVQQAWLLIDILGDLEAAIWDVHGNDLALLAQAEAELDAHVERATGDDPSDDIPF